jgi:hypothetical protein
MLARLAAANPARSYLNRIVARTAILRNSPPAVQLSLHIGCVKQDKPPDWRKSRR